MLVVDENHNMTQSVRTHTGSVHDQTSAGGEERGSLAESNGSAITWVGGFLFCSSSLSLKPNVKTVQAMR